MAPTKEMIENLHTSGEAAGKIDREPRDDHLPFLEEGDELFDEVDDCEL